MALLAIRELTKSFGGLVAISDLSFSIEAGEIVGVIGPNGAGKTTCFNLITGFTVPDAGSVVFEDRPITGKYPEEICRRGLFKTFQTAQCFPELTVRENVLVAAMLHQPSLALAGKESDRLLETMGMMEKRDVKARYLTVPERKRLDS